MKKTVIGVFKSRMDAEKAINFIHNKYSIPNSDISYIYRNTENEVREVDAGSISSNTPEEGARKGASTGAALGALAGIAMVAGVIPVVGPFLAAGPILAALGITGAVGAAAAGAVGGAMVGGLLGALANMGVGAERAKKYEDEVATGNILVSVQTDDPTNVQSSMVQHNATDVEAYGLTI